MAKKRSRNPTLRAFGERLTELRGTASREQISIKLEKLGVPLGGSTLAQYEKGAVWAPDPGVLMGLAKIYNEELQDLLTLLVASRADPSATLSGLHQSAAGGDPMSALAHDAVRRQSKHEHALSVSPAARELAERIDKLGGEVPDMINHVLRTIERAAKGTKASSRQKRRA